MRHTIMASSIFAAIFVLSLATRGRKRFEFKGTNGFMIAFDINSKDVEGKKWGEILIQMRKTPDFRSGAIRGGPF